ncbi:MAG TPA: DinB family protein [Planctomycetaceae bacterium]|nr:DinB family protein [Planctomycetaceae bacterium]
MTPSSFPCSGRRCEASEISADYHRALIDATPGDDVLVVLNDQMTWLCNLASEVSADQVDLVHSPYSWTIRQVFEHCADAERVFGYRMMRLAAGDATDLPGWDENAYAASRFGLGNFVKIVSEIGLLRQSNLLLLKRISPKCWNHVGTVDGKRLTVRALAWIAAGHLRHHLEIVEKRLGVDRITRK